MLERNHALYLQATTATLSAIIVMQVMNVFLCRSTARGEKPARVWGNRLLLCGVAASLTLILLIDYTPWGNALFGTAPIGLDVWLYVLPFAAAMWGLETGRKLAVRRFLR
jgi:magnesium-transporting ATPase (P-type)